MKNAHCIVTIIAMLTVTACQRRAVCKIKTTNGGTSYVRVYQNNFNTSAEYNDAISQYKKQGYACDDSVAFE
jgi:hypothetical protein